MVMTSHDRLGETGQPTGVWLEELAAPYYVFQQAGYDVVMASPQGGPPPLDPKSLETAALTDAARRFLEDPQAQSLFRSTLPLSEVRSHQAQALFFPGGHGPLWDLAEDPDCRRLVETFAQERKPIGAVCHGPAVLRRAQTPDGSPLVAGRELTGFSNSEEEAVGLTRVVPFALEDELVRLGARYSRGEDWQAYMVMDGRLVTGQNPASSEGCAEGIVELLKSSSPSDPPAAHDLEE